VAGRRPAARDRTNPQEGRVRERDAIVIVAKPPEAGRVKTRLCPLLTPEEAAELARAFLDDTIAFARQVSGADVLIGHAGVATWFFRAYPGVPLLPQGEGDLGARMARLFGAAFREGYRRVILIGADTPHLGPGRLERAFLALETPGTVVLGPAEDGGYYLIGLSAPCAALFEGIAWGRDRVLAETLYRADAKGLKTHLLPMERDIDTPDDLAWLSCELARLPAVSATARLLLHRAPPSTSAPVSGDRPPP